MDITKISQFLQEDNGKFSSVRLILVLWSLGILVIWGSVSFSNKKIEPIDNNLEIILGILLTGKVTQKPLEKINK